jgi:hypothetical protein
MTPSLPVRRLAALVASVASVTAVLASGAQPATGADPKPAPTDATITWNAPTIRVKVTSPVAACKDRRRTFIAFDTGNPFSGAAHGRTNSNGVYSLSGEGGPPEDGDLLAYIGKSRSTCRPAQTDLVHIEGEEVARAARQARTFAKLTGDGGTFTVTVKSPKASCVENRKVDIFAYLPGDSFAQVLSGRTDDEGVFTPSFESAVAGVPEFRLVSFVRTTRACTVGQSNTLSVSPS